MAQRLSLMKDVYPELKKALESVGLVQGAIRELIENPNEGMDAEEYLRGAKVGIENTMNALKHQKLGFLWTEVGEKVSYLGMDPRD